MCVCTCKGSREREREREKVTVIEGGWATREGDAGNRKKMCNLTVTLVS